MFEWLLMALVLFVVLILLGGKGGAKLSNKKALYTRKTSLLSPAELKFYRCLISATPKHYWIFAQVRLADVIQMRPRKQMSKKEWWSGFSKISQKHLDFVFVKKETAEIVGAVELNDSSHSQKKRQVRDEFLRNALNQAGVPLVEIRAKSYYDLEQLKTEIGFIDDLDRASAA